ncbi:MAG: hypothetical protein JW769_01455 [Parachlamydiales bacterium]|nr:hypothetical protein [Parachlamydiales bacterium]
MKIILSFLALFYCFGHLEANDIRNTIIKKGILRADTKKPKKLPLSAEVFVDLKNPTYSNGILVTHEGGVIYSDQIRIQAKTIQYIQRKEKGQWVHRVEAEGDLMIRYREHVFVGEELEYDFIKKTGVIYEGKTFAAPWFLGGDKIKIHSDGSYKVKNVFITTCENKDSSWDIHAKKLDVFQKDLLFAKKVRFRLFKIPTVWLPSFKMNLKKFFSKPIMQYKVTWDKKAGPRPSLRYQVYSWKDFLMFIRADYRLKRKLSKGLGAALETEYHPEHQRTLFDTRSYIANDMLPNDPKKRRRYRIQGFLSHHSKKNKTTAHATFDKYSDIHMPGDFRSEDFELNTAKKTELLIRNQQKNLITFFHVLPRVNSFQTLKQEIPYLFLHFRPLTICPTGIIFAQWLSFSYLDLAYSDQLSDYLNNIHAGRIQGKSSLYKPFTKGPLTVTPEIGINAIGYANHSESKGLFALYYGGSAHLNLERKYASTTHRIKPYVRFDGLTKPTATLGEKFIFSIDDGYHKINYCTAGLGNFFCFTHPHFQSINIDLYNRTFLDGYDILPKIYLDGTCNLSSVTFTLNSAWNIKKNLFDYTNARLGWTLSSSVAFATEFRHRSKYDWRKTDHTNFYLDVTRSEEDLLSSPLSDRRNTLLFKGFFRFTPYWSCLMESHHGWGRKNESSYNEFKIDLFRMISTSWKVRFSYQHTQTDDRFNVGLSLVKK